MIRKKTLLKIVKETILEKLQSNPDNYNSEPEMRQWCQESNFEYFQSVNDAVLDKVKVEGFAGYNPAIFIFTNLDNNIPDIQVNDDDVCEVRMSEDYSYFWEGVICKVNDKIRKRGKQHQLIRMESYSEKVGMIYFD